MQGEIVWQSMALFRTINGIRSFDKVIALGGHLLDKSIKELEENLKKIKGEMRMKNEMVKIEEKEMTVKEWKGQRVVTAWEIAEVHEKEVRIVNQQFERNKKYFIQGEDFLEITKEEFVITFCDNGISQQILAPIKTVRLFTESGYMMLVKSFKDDLSWKVQRQLVNVYFKAKATISHTEAVQAQPDNTILFNYVIREIEALKKAVNDLKCEGTTGQLPLFGNTTIPSPRAIFNSIVKQISAEKNCPLQYVEIYNRLERETGKKYRLEAEKAKLLVIDYIEKEGDLGKAINIAEEMLR